MVYYIKRHAVRLRKLFARKQVEKKATLLEMDDYSAALLLQLEKFKTDKKKQDWLMLLYQKYSDSFSKDNDKIWSTGSVFIPLSLAGLINLKDASVLHTILLAFGSISIMKFWVWIAENHRGFQNRSLAITLAIEKYIELDLNWKVDGKIQAKIDAHISARKYPIKNLRWRMLNYVRIVWSVAVGAAIVKSIPFILPSLYQLEPNDFFCNILNKTYDFYNFIKRMI